MTLITRLCRVYLFSYHIKCYPPTENNATLSKASEVEPEQNTDDRLFARVVSSDEDEYQEAAKAKGATRGL